MARVSGLLHDIGKCSEAFQVYIGEQTSTAKVDHSTAGALEATRLFGHRLGRLLAFIIAGHHTGLANGEDLERRLGKAPPSYDGWLDEVGPLMDVAALRPTSRLTPSAERGFSDAFLVRMVFSCLVDADRLETAAFYAEAGEGCSKRVEPTPLPILCGRLATAMSAMTKKAVNAVAVDGNEQLRLARLRRTILDHAIAKAKLMPGLFTMTVPTGGGKTLASLSFALEHAVVHRLRRIIYVIPFTSIIEQTAAVFREVLSPAPGVPNENDVLEHHATFDWEARLQQVGEAGRGTDPLERLQRATENWDAPIVVTTAVQFFESLFASRPSACRKLHNLTGSVIVLDEAQTLPLPILRPCLAALDELARNYGASIVVCTATQPAWRKADKVLVSKAGLSFGLDLPPDRELAPDPRSLFTAMKRVVVEHRRGPTEDGAIIARFAQAPQMLCIVNSRRHAKALFDAVAELPGTIHLSTWMCPRHRRLVLEKARTDLKAGEPVRIVSTSLIEAGVDIDLPEVWRAAAGLDSLLQAAGRCNREFRLSTGRLVIFEPAEARAPHDLKQAWQAGRAVLRRHDDPQTLEAIAAYFHELYTTKGSEAFDASTILREDGGKEAFPILTRIAERADTALFPFASIARAFRVIEDAMASVIVPWSSGAGDEEAAALIAKIRAMDAPSRSDLRRLQQYTVSVPKPARDRWLADGVLAAVHPRLGEAMLCFPNVSLYDRRSGLRVLEPDHRSAASNVMGS